MGFDLRSAFIGIAVFVIALLFLGAVYAVLGLYDIGADAPHMGITRAAIGYVRERSIAVRAQASGAGIGLKRGATRIR